MAFLKTTSAALGLGLLLVLSGCSEEAIRPDPNVVVSATPKTRSARGLDVFGGRSGAPRYYGEKTITFLSDNGFLPVAGASCVLSNDFFEARFVTPALVRVPDYRRASPSATVRCTRDSDAGCSEHLGRYPCGSRLTGRTGLSGGHGRDLHHDPDRTKGVS